MRRDGGLDKQGYLVYRTDLPGLANHCWKDSLGAICFPSGEPATGPIAVCEAQGYAYDALRGAARLARDVWADPTYADQLDTLATDLQARFIADFWCDNTEYPALALDGDRRAVPTITSNPGHLLWSGILDQDRALATGRRLLADDMFSGWGIRTLAARQPAYHPISYHRGGVWPHDTALAVAGLARQGMRDEAVRVAEGLIDAAANTNGRLPELITGHDRTHHTKPVQYPHACSPQAWAAATPLLLTSILTEL
jgi:glycogen debranching enzyme